MGNINGKAYAMNTVSPMKPRRSLILRMFFFFWRHYKPLSRGLVELSFIHFARWVIIRRTGFPWVSKEQPREDLRYDYLFFFSNFNGTWNQHIDAFSAVLYRGLNMIWGRSEKFPGSVPVTPFKNFILRGQIETDYCHTACPHATTNDVKAAHRVQAALDVVVSFLRRDLALLMVVSSLNFTVLYFALFFYFLTLYPDFVQRFYNVPNLFGIYILGVPIEELMFAGSGGAVWRVAYEYIQGYRFSQDRSLRLAHS